MRFRSLDGLRGAAAVVVVISHWVSIYNQSPGSPFETVPLLSLISLIFGNLASHAVWLFFVLSGFVLSKTFSTRTTKYWRYLASRGIRLYVPTVSAIVLTYLTIAIVPRNGIDEFNWWMASHPSNPTAVNFLQDITLIFGGSGTMLVLWSLTYEIWFSILLGPLLSVLKRFSSILGLLLLSALSGLGNWFQLPIVEYLPMFMIGIVLQKILFTNAQDQNEQISVGRELLLVCAAIILLVFSYVTFFKAGLRNVGYSLDVTLSLLSFAIVIYIALRGQYMQKILESKIMLYFGTISFSLYLVHETILVNAVLISGNNFVVVSAAVVVAFVAADVFSRLIESRSHKLARGVLLG